MIGKMFSRFRNPGCTNLLPSYDAMVIPKEGDSVIFGGYHISLDAAKSYINRTYPNKYYVSYSKVYLTNELSVTEVNGVELK